MPILEFRCKSCEAVTEELVLAGDVAATPVCRKCGKQELTRLLSTFAAGSSRGTGDAAACGAPQEACGGGMCGMSGGCPEDF
jgi:putative FmdB family regulatory protein